MNFEDFWELLDSEDSASVLSLPDVNTNDKKGVDRTLAVDDQEELIYQ
ncbi:MAG: hypothetical protein KDD61_14870 [Bdellovibrionales bacterium]|nr:hypothetical protein [Bdellovibrionales bacterium]